MVSLLNFYVTTICNLNLRYQPDHWCKVPGLNNTELDLKNYSWNSVDTLTFSIVFPKTKNKQRDVLDFHSQVYFFLNVLIFSAIIMSAMKSVMQN